MKNTDLELKKFAARVRAIREATGLSQEDFATKAQMDRAGYGRVERGIVDVRLTTIIRLADALNVSIGTLFGESERMISTKKAKGTK